jgi:hypothetical protein
MSRAEYGRLRRRAPEARASGLDNVRRNGMDKSRDAILRRGGIPPVPEADMLSPDEAVAELRALIARVPEVVDLTPLERETLRRSVAMSDSAILAAIGVLDVSVEIAQVVGQPDDVRQRYRDDGHWHTFETELKVAWKKIADTNIVRRQRTRLLALQAYRIAQQLARTPGNDGLNVHVKEVMRLRNLGRRRRAAKETPEVPETDAATPSGTE